MKLQKYIKDNWVGVPYLSKGTTKKGVDCSGFIYKIFLDFFKKDIGRKSSSDYHKMSKEVNKEKISEGDVVFFSHRKGQINHVGIMVDKKNFAHASTSKGVIITPLTNVYWSPRIVSYGKLT
jgi:murein DD-endopeptidase / murein LD-carboxypeptidase